MWLHLATASILALMPGVVSSPLQVFDSCYVVETESGNVGTAFAISDQQLLTAAHVVEGVTTVLLRSSTDARSTMSATVVLADERRDVAVLSIAGSRSVAPLAFAPRRPSAGTPAYAIGSPIGDLVLSRGKVLGFQDGLIESSVPVDHGNSGGPLFDDGGRVLGVVVSMSSLSGNSYAVPVEDIQQVLAVAETAEGPAAQGPSVQDPGEASLDSARRNGLLAVVLAVVGVLVLVGLLGGGLLVGATRRQRHRRQRIVIRAGDL